MYEPSEWVIEQGKRDRARQKALKYSGSSTPWTWKQRIIAALVLSSSIAAMVAINLYFEHGHVWAIEREQRNLERNRNKEEMKFAKQLKKNEYVKFIGKNYAIINMDGIDWHLLPPPGATIDEYKSLVVVSMDGRTHVFSKNKPLGVDAGLPIPENRSDNHKEAFEKYCKIVEKHSRQMKELCTSYERTCLNHRFIKSSTYQTCKECRSLIIQRAFVNQKKGPRKFHVR